MRVSLSWEQKCSSDMRAFLPLAHVAIALQPGVKNEMHFAEAEACLLSYVQLLGHGEEGQEGCYPSLVDNAALQASELHVGVLARGVASPVLPEKSGFHSAHALCQGYHVPEVFVVHAFAVQGPERAQSAHDKLKEHFE